MNANARSLIALILSAIFVGLIVWNFVSFESVGQLQGTFDFNALRQMIWSYHGIVMVVIALITSVVMISAVFAMEFTRVMEVETQ